MAKIKIYQKNEGWLFITNYKYLNSYDDLIAWSSHVDMISKKGTRH